MGTGTSTTHCSISKATVMDGIPIIKWLKATTGDEKPGMCGYLPTSTTFDLADSATAGSLLHHLSFPEFQPRIASTGARKSPEDAYDAAELMPVIIMSREGRIKIVAATTDIGANMFRGQRMDVSSTAGNLDKSAVSHQETGVFLAEDSLDDDRYAAVWSC
jgi:hypothetical protein